MADQPASTQHLAQPDPLVASSAAELVAQLNRLRAWAGQPSFRTLRDLAGVRPGSGNPPVEALPPSTTHEILSGRRLPRLPRLDFVEAFVAACLRARRYPRHEIEAETERWRRAWRTIAAAAHPGADGSGPPVAATTASTPNPTPADQHRPDGLDATPASSKQASGSPARRWVAIALATVVLLGAGAAVGISLDRWLSDESPPPPATDANAPIDTMPDLVLNGGFQYGAEPWWRHGQSVTVKDGQAHITVAGNTGMPWDDQLGQGGIRVQKDRTYTLAFDAAADAARTIRVVLQVDTPPYPSVFQKDIALTVTAPPQLTPFAFRFTSFMAIDKGQLVFQFGGHGGDYTIRLDNVALIEHPA